LYSKVDSASFNALAKASPNLSEHDLLEDWNVMIELVALRSNETTLLIPSILFALKTILLELFANQALTPRKLRHLPT
jgi:hypothetical protein